MRRLVGTLLVVHALAHASLGMWMSPTLPVAFAVLWWIAMVGFIAAGAGLIGMARLDRYWRPPAIVASLASLMLLTMHPHPVLLIGAAVDALVLIDCLPFAHETIGRQLGLMVHPPHRHLGKTATAVGVILMAYVSLLVLTRPWNATWSASSGELIAPLHGNEQPNLRAVARGPIGLLVTEPVRFIVQRARRQLGGTDEHHR